MDQEATEVLDALFRGSFQQTARIEALETAVAALVSSLTSINPLLPNQFTEMLGVLADIRATQMNSDESISDFKAQIKSMSDRILFLSARR